MTDIVIRVDHLSKLYHIGRAQQRHDTLRDVLSSVFSHQSSGRSSQSSVFGRQSHSGTDNRELKTDDSCRITEPTSGPAETCPEQRRRIHGRVASLLESLS